MCKVVWIQADKILSVHPCCCFQRFNGIFPSSWSKYHITLKELYPIIVSFHLWGNLLANKCIIINFDNEAAVHIINNHTSSDSINMCLVRQFVLVLPRYNILCRASHIPGKLNIVADLLSRLQVTLAREVAPSLDLREWDIPDSLSPSNILSSSCWKLPRLRKYLAFTGDHALPASTSKIAYFMAHFLSRAWLLLPFLNICLPSHSFVNFITGLIP